MSFLRLITLVLVFLPYITHALVNLAVTDVFLGAASNMDAAIEACDKIYHGSLVGSNWGEINGSTVAHLCQRRQRLDDIEPGQRVLQKIGVYGATECPPAMELFYQPKTFRVVCLQWETSTMVHCSGNYISDLWVSTQRNYNNDDVGWNFPICSLDLGWPTTGQRKGKQRPSKRREKEGDHGNTRPHRPQKTMGEGVTPGKDPPDRIPSPAPNEFEDNALLDSQEQTRREDSGGPRDKHATREDCEKDSYDASSTGDTNNATGDLVASETSEGADNSVTTQACESQGAGGASQEATGVFNKFNKLELNLEREWTTVRKGRPNAKKPTTYAPPIGHKPVTGRRVLRAGEDFGNRKKSEQGATTVWTAQGAAAIRAKLVGSAGTPLDLTTEREDETVHAQYYMCALKKPKAMMRDGDQRPMTKKEKHTLFLWASKQIHLAEPPLFIDETHVGKEQDAIRGFHKDHLGYRLYMRLPVGTKWSHRSGQKLLVMALMEGCKDNDAQEKRVLRLLSDVQEVLLEPNSQIVTLRFVRPDIRKVWMDQTFNFHRPT